MRKLIVFDYDGTIADTKHAYVKMISRSFKKINVPVKSDDVAKALLPSIKGTIENLLKLSNRYEVKLVSRLENMTIDYLSARWMEYLMLADGIQILLDRLCTDDHKLYLASNSHSSFVMPAVKKFGLEVYFQDIITLDSGYRNKGEMLAAIAGRSECTVTDLTYIADTLMDVELAEKVGCRLIVFMTPLSWNYDRRKSVESIAGNRDNIEVANNIQELESKLL